MADLECNVDEGLDRQGQAEKQVVEKHADAESHAQGENLLNNT